MVPNQLRLPFPVMDNPGLMEEVRIVRHRHHPPYGGPGGVLLQVSQMDEAILTAQAVDKHCPSEMEIIYPLIRNTVMARMAQLRRIVVEDVV